MSLAGIGARNAAGGRSLARPANGGPVPGLGTDRSVRWLSLVSPPVLFLAVWGLACLIAWRVLSRPLDNDLAHLFIARHRLDPAAFAAGPLIWGAILAGSLGLGYAAAGAGLRPRSRALADPSPAATTDALAVRVFALNAVCLAVTAIWVLLTMQAAGGAAAFYRLTTTDPLAARDMLLERKLFTGMRLLYAALPALAALAAALIAEGKLNRRGQRLCILVILVNLVTLVALTAVMSQRLLVMQLVVAAIVAASCAQGRLVPLWSIALAIAVFAGAWLLREAITNPGLDRGATEIATQKFAFYIVNDLWNTARPLLGDAPSGGGLFTFQFALFFTLTDGAVYAAHAERLALLATFRGGGEFSLLSAPFVDFGPLGAAAYLFLYGGVMRLLWHRASTSAGDAAIYGQAATAILLSVHANFAASQDFVVAVAVILAVTRWPARARQGARAHAAA